MWLVLLLGLFFSTSTGGYILSIHNYSVRLNKLIYLNKVTILALLSFILLGCGGQETGSDTDNGGNKPAESISIDTQSTLDFVPESVLTSVDLTSKVRSDSGQDLHITDITPLSDYNNFDFVDVSGLKFRIETEEAQVCRFRYTVEPASGDFSGSQSGISQIVVSDESTVSSPLPPISKTAYQSEVLVIDLTSYLPEGFSLDNTSIELVGYTDTGDVGAFESQGNSITYTAPDEALGVVTIYYSAINDLMDILPGVIYVTISDTANTAPIVSINVALEDKILADSPTDSFTINIEDYVSDADGDELQLTEVFTNGLGWATNLTQYTFEYNPNLSGMQYLTYIVTDDRGGYGIGTLNFKVRSYGIIFDDDQDVTFYPTYTLEEVASTNGSFSGTYTENGTQGEAGQYPIFNEDLADAYCVTRGLVLPVISQLRSLYTDPLSNSSVFTSQYKWPSGSSYIAIDGIFSLFDGASSLTQGQVGYVSCIEQVELPSDYNFSSKYLGADWNENSIVLASAEVNGNHIPLPPSKYELEYKVVDTNPANLADQVIVEVQENNIIVKQASTRVFQAVLEITDPNNVQGSLQDTTTLIVGTGACPNGVTVNDTQFLGCIPVLDNNETSEKYTAAVADHILINLGYKLDLFGDDIPYLTTSNTTPVYSYYRTDILGQSESSIKQSIGLYAQDYCDILNAAEVGGRDNWIWYQQGGISNPPSREQFENLEGTLAAELTRWMSDATGLSVADVGQGVFVFQDKITHQLNQDVDNNRMRYQYNPQNPWKAWQYITCYSSD